MPVSNTNLQTDANRGQRDRCLDALRGFCVLLMVCDHLPYSPIQILTSHPIGLFDTAMVFVFLSGYVCGWRYGATAVRRSVCEARAGILRRLFKIVLAHHAIATITVIAVLYAGAGPLRGFYSAVHLYAQHPWRAWIREILLLRESPLLDILKLYILLFAGLALTLPWLLSGTRKVLLLASAVLWAIDSFEVLPAVTESLKSVFGFFHPLAWQFVFVLGLWWGSSRLQPEPSRWSLPRWLRYVACAGVLAGLILRRPGTPYVNPFANTNVDLLFSSENVGAVRLLNFLFVSVVFAAIPRLWRDHFGNSRLVKPLVVVGQHSLVLYAIHGLLVYSAEAAFPHWETVPWLVRTAATLTACVSLFAPAYLLNAYHDWARQNRAALPVRLTPASAVE